MHQQLPATQRFHIHLYRVFVQKQRWRTLLRGHESSRSYQLIDPLNEESEFPCHRKEVLQVLKDGEYRFDISL